jgi:hypothetical protein
MVNVTQIQLNMTIKDSLSIINDNFANLQQKLCNLNDEICSTAAALSGVVDKSRELYSYIYFNYPKLDIPPEPTPKPLPEIYAGIGPITGATAPVPPPTPYLVPFPAKNL